MSEIERIAAGLTEAQRRRLMRDSLYPNCRACLESALLAHLQEQTP